MTRLRVCGVVGRGWREGGDIGAAEKWRQVSTVFVGEAHDAQS